VLKPPQSKTLARIPVTNKWREASWSAPVLWRFVWWAQGKDLRAAQAAAYAAVECIQFEGAQFRRDIAAKAFKQDYLAPGFS
jgi:hypothetical protein